MTIAHIVCGETFYEDLAIQGELAPVCAEAGTEDEDLAAYIINNDQMADWALRQIARERAEVHALKTHYDQQLKAAKEACERRTAHLLRALDAYLDKIPARETKTQKKYALPSGTLMRMHQQPAYERDEEALLKWAIDTDFDAFVRVESSPRWKAIKKVCERRGAELVDRNTGEVVPGVRVVDRPDLFDIVPSKGADQ